MQCAWQVEINPYCQRVLAKHWPEVPKHDDIRTFEPTPVDVVCGGFPCQDISKAGKGAGLNGSESGLWYEFERIIGDIRPRFVAVENVPTLRVRGLGAVLRGLAENGYDAEWLCLKACQFGAPHERERMFVLGWDSDAVRCPWDDREKREIQDSNADTNRVSWWESEPDVGRMADGVSRGLDTNRRIEGLANSVVPQVAEWIGLRLMECAV
jgi:DNA (cytosine-5)-methyltransferase 1